jgi:hypothetical protein
MCRCNSQPCGCPCSNKLLLLHCSCTLTRDIGIFGLINSSQTMRCYRAAFSVHLHVIQLHFSKQPLSAVYSTKLQNYLTLQTSAQYSDEAPNSECNPDPFFQPWVSSSRRVQTYVLDQLFMCGNLDRKQKKSTAEIHAKQNSCLQQPEMLTTQ